MPSSAICSTGPSASSCAEARARDKRPLERPILSTRVDHEAVTDVFGQLRTDGYHRKGRLPTSGRPAAIRKRRSRLLKAKTPKKGLGEKSVSNIRATLRTILVAASNGAT